MHITPTPRAALRRQRSLLTTVVAAVVASLVLVPSAAQAEQPVSAQNAAGSLQRYLNAHDDHFTVHFTDENGQPQSSPDYGLTLDAVIAMDAAGVGDTESARATTFVADHIGSYIGTGTESYPGAIAKALLTSLSQGRTPKGFLGGVNLVTRLKARQTSTGQFKDKSQFGDFSNTIGQSLAVISLRKAGQALGTKAVPFLANSQCPNGGFRLALSVNQCSNNANADPDATSFAIQGLLSGSQTSAVKTRISRAIHFLRTQQGSDGGVKGAGPTNTENSNSTGLAVLAFSTTGHPNAATQGRLYLRSLRYDCTFPAEMRGAIAYDAAGFANARSQGAAATLSDQDLRATAQATLGFAPVPLYKVTNVGAKASAPAFAC